MSESQVIPWKRIAVEATAIVASILLAFTIDAWWDDRKERVEEREILESLQVEFEANRDGVAAVLRVHDEALRYAAQLMSLTEIEVLALSETDVERHVRYFAYPRTFDAVRGTVDALISSGKLGILQDRELRESLTTFVNMLEDAGEDREYMTRWAMIIWQELSRNGGPYWQAPENRSLQDCVEGSSESYCYLATSTAFLPTATPQDLLRLRKNKVLMGHVNRNHVTSARYAAETMNAKQQIETVLTLLEKILRN